jgi:hypothetical protein
MNVLTWFITHGETPDAIEPRQCVIHQIPIASQVLSYVRTAAVRSWRKGVQTAFG